MNIGIKISMLSIIMYLLILLPITLCTQQCENYLLQLQNQSISDPKIFAQTMTPYLILSGKSLDDLGFPGSCIKDQNSYSYSTVRVHIQTNTTQHSGFLGFCFTSMCSVEDLNTFGQFIIDFIFAEYPYGVSGQFISPPLQLQFSVSALVLSLIFAIFIIIAMLAPIQHWIKLCRHQSDPQYQIKSVYIDLQNPSNQFDEQRITVQSTLTDRLSLKYKWNQLWKQQTTYNIWSFSLFRVLGVPLLLYGQIFWLTNFGAYNYYAFYQDIYQQFYVKVAIFAYYIPDIFFFISAFLFTKKVLTFEDDHHKRLLKAIGWKLLRLYPLYIVVLAIYWGITPGLHAGPVWFVYQDQANICNTSWWKVFLMIDNWFQQSCYSGLWFVQVQVQFLLSTSALFFTIFLYNRKIGLYFFGAYFITALVLLYVLSAQMIVSIEIALDPYTQLYFKSFYSHLFFYLCGILFAILADKQSIRIALQVNILDKPFMNIGLKLFAVGMLILILLRPWIWIGTTPLEIQLAFCRLGTLLSFIILFLYGMFVRETNTSVIHKYGYYMYPVILVSYMVELSSFWSVGSFMYVSGYDILNEMVPNFIISYALGIFLGILFDTRTLITSSASN